MSNEKIQIRAEIAGHSTPRDKVLAWEERRFPKAAHKLGIAVPSGSLGDRRKAFCESKLALDHQDIKQRLRRDIALSDATAYATAGLSFKRRSASICDLYVTGGDMETFVNWFNDTERDDYAYSMVRANPDHFIIDTAEDGSQEVIETTGGSPLATQFYVDYEDISPLVTSRDPDFPEELAGVALTKKGLGIGGVRHQLRNTLDGFHLRACVEFPLLMPSHMVHEHRWHLACEFSNWIEHAFEGK